MNPHKKHDYLTDVVAPVGNYKIYVWKVSIKKHHLWSDINLWNLMRCEMLQSGDQDVINGIYALLE